jgi:hypothetical protein
MRRIGTFASNDESVAGNIDKENAKDEKQEREMAICRYRIEMNNPIHEDAALNRASTLGGRTKV